MIELRDLGRRRAKTAARLALIALGVGAAAVGVIVVWRLARPATPRERLQRLLPAGTLKDLKRVRETLELRGRRRVPPMRLYVGDRRAGEEPESGTRWERVAAAAAGAAGRAAAGALLSRVLKELRPRSK